MPIKQTITGIRRINNDDLPSRLLPDGNALHHYLPEKLGLGHSNIFRLSPELNYIETHYTPRHDLAILSRMEHQEPRMVVTLGLQGNSRFTTQRGDEVAFKEGYTAITTFNSSEGSRQYRGNRSVTQLRFAMTKSWLEAYFGERQTAALFDKSAMRVVSHRPISPQSLIAAHALLNCKVAEQVRPLFRQGQAMAILAGELSHLLNGGRQETSSFDSRDKAMADLARDILFEEFQNPPSVEALAKRVGTNQCKLKQLFHHCFGNTPYGLLLDIRMKKAYQLLQSGRCSVAIAAEAVGYNHASNFSSAFAKYFGCPPKRIARQQG